MEETAAHSTTETQKTRPQEQQRRWLWCGHKYLNIRRQYVAGGSAVIKMNGSTCIVAVQFSGDSYGRVPGDTGNSRDTNDGPGEAEVTICDGYGAGGCVKYKSKFFADLVPTIREYWEGRCSRSENHIANPCCF